MPNSPEHKVAMNFLAAARKAAGLPSWKERLDFSDFWWDETIPLRDRLQKVIEVIRASNWFKTNRKYDLESLIDEVAWLIEEEENDDYLVEEFDYLWDQFYDLADYDRIWFKLQ